jgi:hypothetical protein
MHGRTIPVAIEKCSIADPDLIAGGQNWSTKKEKIKDFNV